ncbi:MAG: PT domain-containing protein [Lachnospiraceae bacterium]|nr:PT domain-containing protein [Lachnospiraceae bacterium]
MNKKVLAGIIIVCVCMALTAGGILLYDRSKLSPSETSSEGKATPEPTKEVTAEPTEKATEKPTAKPTEKVTEEPTEKPTPAPVQGYYVKRLVWAESPYGSVECHFNPDNGSLTEKLAYNRWDVIPLWNEQFETVYRYKYSNGGRTVTQEDVTTYPDEPGYTFSGMGVYGLDGMNGSLETGFNGIISILGDYSQRQTADVIRLGSEYNVEYDEFGRVSKAIFLKCDYRYSTYRYDVKGNMVQRTDFDTDGTEIRRCEFLYDNDGRLLSAKNLTPGDGQISYISFRYDENGCLLVATSYTENNTVAAEQRFFYDDDLDLIRIESGAEGSSEVSLTKLEYETMYVEETFLTNQERKKLGLPYDESLVFEQVYTVDPYTWAAASDLARSEEFPGPY